MQTFIFDPEAPPPGASGVLETAGSLHGPTELGAAGVAAGAAGHSGSQLRAVGQLPHGGEAFAAATAELAEGLGFSGGPGRPMPCPPSPRAAKPCGASAGFSRLRPQGNPTPPPATATTARAVDSAAPQDEGAPSSPPPRATELPSPAAGILAGLVQRCASFSGRTGRGLPAPPAGSLAEWQGPGGAGAVLAPAEQPPLALALAAAAVAAVSAAAAKRVLVQGRCGQAELPAVAAATGAAPPTPSTPPPICSSDASNAGELSLSLPGPQPWFALAAASMSAARRASRDADAPEGGQRRQRLVRKSDTVGGCPAGAGGPRPLKEGWWVARGASIDGIGSAYGRTAAQVLPRFQERRRSDGPAVAAAAWALARLADVTDPAADGLAAGGSSPAAAPGAGGAASVPSWAAGRGAGQGVEGACSSPTALPAELYTTAYSAWPSAEHARFLGPDPPAPLHMFGRWGADLTTTEAAAAAAAVVAAAGSAAVMSEAAAALSAAVLSLVVPEAAAALLARGQRGNGDGDGDSFFCTLGSGTAAQAGAGVLHLPLPEPPPAAAARRPRQTPCG
jgi:hypothetical protein